MSKLHGPVPENLLPLIRVIAEEGIWGIVSFHAHTGVCLFANRVAREVLELSTEPGPAVGLSLAKILPVADASSEKAGFGRRLTNEMIQSRGYHPDVYFMRSNGHAVFANVDIEHLDGSGGEPAVVLSFQDITLQKKLQRDLQMKQDQIHSAYSELLEQNKQLLELDLAKDKFIALTTHELRTPLSAIVAMTEALVLGYEESPEQHREFLKTVHEQSLHLMDLVNDILDFAKIRAGKMEFYVEQIDLRTVIKQAVINFDSMAEQANLTFKLPIMEAPFFAYADSLRLREVLDNVVNNAIKYNRSGGQVRIHLTPVGNRMRITVADDGKGIPADQIAKVFNEFETLNSVSLHHKGTGLGMPISKNLMAAMGGELSLTSQVNVGSEFHIDIPVERVLPEEFYRARPDSWGDFAA